MAKRGVTASAGGSLEPVHGPIHRASQVAFQRSIAARVPETDPAALALFIYAAGTGRLVDGFQTTIVRAHDLDGAQFTVLFTLWCADPPHRLSPTQLHRLLVQSPSGMSHTLRRLSEAGLIRRRSDAADARAKYVELTGKGIARVRRCVADLVGALEKVYADLPTGKLAELADHQRQVAEVFSRSPLSYRMTSRPVGVDGDGDA